MTIGSLKASLLALTVFASIPSNAEETSAQARTSLERQTISITADSIIANAKSKEMKVSGSVVITMKDLWTIKADEAVIRPDGDAVTVTAEKFEVVKQTHDGK